MAQPARLHREDIKAAIRKKGKTLTQLSLENELAEGTVRKALSEPIPKADRAIAAFLGKPLHTIWPDRYDVHGNRIKKSRLYPKRNTHVRHRQKRSKQFTEGGSK